MKARRGRSFPTAPGIASEQPSVIVCYEIDSSGKRPYSIITTQAADGLSTADTSVRQSTAFVDGFGQTVVALDQADPSAGDGGAYFATGLTDYDLKGNVSDRRTTSAEEDGKSL